MAYTSFANINSLEEFSFIAGSQYTVYFTVYQSDGVNPMDLGGATVYWVLSPYGQTDFTVLQKTATITGTNTFEVDLLSSDTENLNGKYIQQPIIVSFAGKEYRPSQGTVLILPKISYT